MKNLKFITVIIFLSSLIVVKAQTDSKVLIYLMDYTSDRVGASILYSLKNEIVKSSQYKLSYDKNYSPQFAIIFESMDKNQGDDDLEGLATIYSVTWTLYQNDDNGFLTYHLIDHTLGFCGKTYAESVGKDLMAQSSKVFDKFIKNLIEYQK